MNSPQRTAVFTKNFRNNHIRIGLKNDYNRNPPFFYRSDAVTASPVDQEELPSSGADSEK